MTSRRRCVKLKPKRRASSIKPRSRRTQPPGYENNLTSLALFRFGLRQAVESKPSEVLPADKDPTLQEEKAFGRTRIIGKSCDIVWSVLGRWAVREKGGMLVASDRQAGVITFRTTGLYENVSVSVEPVSKQSCSVRVFATGLSALDPKVKGFGYIADWPLASIEWYANKPNTGK
jgi:hypothetical protein